MKAITKCIDAAGGVVDLAKRIKVSPAFVCHMKRGIRKCPPKIAVRLEQEFPDVVSRADLVPDFKDIWPELAEK